MFNYFKLIKKLQKNGNKYKIYSYNIKLFFFLFKIYQNYKLDLKKLHIVYNINNEINLNFFTFIKKNNSIIFLKNQKRLKEFLKIFYILLSKQNFRSFIFRIIFLFLELLFYFDTNIYSKIKNSFFLFVFKKKQKKKLKYSYLGNLELLNMFSIILIFTLIILVILFIRKFFFIKLLLNKFFSYCIRLKNYISNLIFILFFNYKIKNNENNKLLYKPFKFKDFFIFFQFGSKKHSYFKIWFSNLKRKKHWIWKWRN